MVNLYVVRVYFIERKKLPIELLCSLFPGVQLQPSWSYHLLINKWINNSKVFFVVDLSKICSMSSRLISSLQSLKPNLSLTDQSGEHSNICDQSLRSFSVFEI